MDNNERFTSLSELYKRVLPALQLKAQELKREKLNVHTLDIWNYCTEYIWQEKNDLRIYEVVDDILKVDGLKVAIYARNNEKNDEE